LHLPHFSRSACNILCAGGHTDPHPSAGRYPNDRAVTNDGDDNTTDDNATYDNTTYDNTTDNNTTDDRDNNATNHSFSRRTRYARLCPPRNT